MESNLPVPQHSPEMGASSPQVLSRMPEIYTPAQNTPERVVPTERQGVPQQAPALPQPAPIITPIVPAPLLNPVVNSDQNPAVAADEELIEKEWVDKAKQIVVQTKNNPYLQEKEVSKLQADYLKKRYGKEIKLASE